MVTTAQTAYDPHNDSDTVRVSAYVSRGEFIHAFERSEPWYCSRILDADDVRLINGPATRHCRLFGIDAPEQGQPYHNEAKDFLGREILNVPVLPLWLGTDKHGRFVVHILTLNHKPISHSLVQCGLAWAYPAYVGADETLKALETQARTDRLGLWSQANPIAPWNYRAGANWRRG